MIKKHLTVTMKEHKNFTFFQYLPKIQLIHWIFFTVQGEYGDKDRYESLQTLFSVVFTITRLMVCSDMLILNNQILNSHL